MHDDAQQSQDCPGLASAWGALQDTRCAYNSDYSMQLLTTALLGSSPRSMLCKHLAAAVLSLEAHQDAQTESGSSGCTNTVKGTHIPSSGKRNVIPNREMGLQPCGAVADAKMMSVPV